MIWHWTISSRFGPSYFSQFLSFSDGRRRSPSTTRCGRIKTCFVEWYDDRDMRDSFTLAIIVIHITSQLPSRIVS
jgi:hypothetical protein